jgi:hypothetical protein
MTKQGNQSSTLRNIIERIRTILLELRRAAEAGRPPPRERRIIEDELRTIMVAINVLLRNLDPVRQPHFMFDPGNPAVVGRFIALAMIAQPRVSLPEVVSFYGSGIYTLYYRGELPAYSPIRNTETPIYVGKADPVTDNAKTSLEQGEKLSKRIREHLRSIRKATDTLKPEDFDYRCLVVQSGWQGAAEDYLIHLFRPVWNNETGICFGLGKHGDDPTVRTNLRSPWDTMHPGREWAHRDPNMKDARPKEQILAALKTHFEATAIYPDLDTVLKGFMDELKQL